MRAQAKALAAQPYKAPVADLPDPFRQLSPDLYQGIRRRDSALIWRTSDSHFIVEPLLRGPLYTTQVDINLAVGDQVSSVPCVNDDYDFGAIKLPTKSFTLGFSGFRILQKAAEGPAVEIAKFQGASLFRTKAIGQTFGTIARALAIRTADPRGEEFPQFRTFWIEQPAKDSDTLIIHGLVDSASMTGAFRFTLRPGFATIMDIECALFARTEIDHLGIAALSASFLYGTLGPRPIDRLRPRVYEVSGLQMHSGTGEWIWRPVNNRTSLQISVFADNNPKGFGFLQRDRDFALFQDVQQQDEKRPSLWVEPIGDWGEGSIDLVEIPSKGEFNENIVAYWRPKAPIAAGGELNIAYRQIWCWDIPDRHELALVTSSRSGEGAKASWRKFAVDFSHSEFAHWPKERPIDVLLSLGKGHITSQSTYLMKDLHIFRCEFELNPDVEPLCEIRLQLQADNRPISETWLYRWTA